MLTTLRGRIIASYIAVVLPALLLATAAYLVLSINARRNDAYLQLKTTLYLIGPQIAKGITQQRQDIVIGAEDLLAVLGNTTKYRLLVVTANGRISFDSNRGAGTWKNDVIALPAASLTDPNPAVAFTGTLTLEPRGPTWIYAAAPPRTLQRLANTNYTPAPGRPQAYFVLAQQAPDNAVWTDFIGRFLIFALLAGLGAVALGGVLARSLTRPIAGLTRAAHAIAQGDYAHQAPALGSVEMQALAADFNQMAGAVQQSRQAQRDLMANVSHDLKTPLTSIQGFSQAMLDGAVRDPEGFRIAAGVIHNEAQRMARMVADIMDLARFEGRSTPLALVPTDLAPLLAQTAQGLQPQATAQGVQLQVVTTPAPLVAVDVPGLQRALTNLLDNALRHTPAGGTVTLGMQPAGAGLRIFVRDTGSGIPADAVAHIFDRFYQADPSRAGGGHGAGLGLAIVREIVTAHGGTIAVHSTPGVGSEFSILLPLPSAAGRNGGVRPVDAQQAHVL
ncbi:MAG: HAMP domain-containing histidine kinase [Chloroflexota bacterium]|nr:HAMP domain-containing histidine kinase [Chloroflexota bacterium]